MKASSVVAWLAAAFAACLPLRLAHVPLGVLISAVVLIEIEIAMLRFQLPNQLEAQKDLRAARLSGAPREILVAISRARVTTLRSFAAPLWLAVGVVSLCMPTAAPCGSATLASALAAFVLYGAELAFLLIAMTEYRARERLGHTSGVARASAV